MVEGLALYGAFILTTMGAMFITFIIGWLGSFSDDHEGTFITAWFAACIFFGLAAACVLV